ncbi:Glycosyltransferase family 4 protein [Rhodovastum atsumiense]|uniref:Glycosyltransferase family 4 protein n=1 Tax=Rhodovastum atsumiense TaxID=504468 RepID=A0A5M6J3P8_9PROT|nr:glycosyltransferase family 4 protein [Rhodovastum atsumiense]KAA5614285.1 glycosyltransferase family 4 protein [Rhodovastum atsumiense]CAH2604741.1 Glycosyltransferase family 4 protein [Rhodovastum atsumiense]
MRIAQIAPLFESVPPRRYGGTERVVHWLTEELVAMGHDVTLFATGDSVTSAELVPVRERAARFVPNFERNNAPYARMLEMVRRRAHEFDVLHFHIDFHPFALFSRQSTPFLTTLHGRLDQDWVPEIYDLYPDVPLVSISDSQRRPMPHLHWAGTVLHGMPAHLLTPQPVGERDYFAFLGRISPEKGIESAIRIAEAAGVKLKVAAKIGEEDAQYYRDVVAPLLQTGNVEFIGEIGDAEKPDFLSGAKALLFPIDWPEPFGLVMIEAMACGCPVIAFRRGSVPEVVEDGLTGFVVDTVDQAVAACAQVEALDRAAVRRRFEQRWTSWRMARDYLGLYDRLAQRAALKLASD